MGERAGTAADAAAWNRRMADQFGLCLPEDTPGFPYDGGAPGAGRRIDAYDERRRRGPTETEQQAIDAAETAGRQWAEEVRNETGGSGDD